MSCCFRYLSLLARRTLAVVVLLGYKVRNCYAVCYAFYTSAVTQLRRYAFYIRPQLIKPDFNKFKFNSENDSLYFTLQTANLLSYCFSADNSHHRPTMDTIQRHKHAWGDGGRPHPVILKHAGTPGRRDTTPGQPTLGPATPATITC